MFDLVYLNSIHEIMDGLNDCDECLIVSLGIGSRPSGWRLWMRRHDVIRHQGLAYQAISTIDAQPTFRIRRHGVRASGGKAQLLMTFRRQSTPSPCIYMVDEHECLVSMP